MFPRAGLWEILAEDEPDERGPGLGDCLRWHATHLVADGADLAAIECARRALRLAGTAVDRTRLRCLPGPGGHLPRDGAARSDTPARRWSDRGGGADLAAEGVGSASTTRRPVGLCGGCWTDTRDGVGSQRPLLCLCATRFGNSHRASDATTTASGECPDLVRVLQRTWGATFAPSNSMLCSTFSCGRVPTLVCSMKRSRPRVSRMSVIFSAT